MSGGEDGGPAVEEALRLDIGAMVEPGTRVEVLSRFDRSWARGFEIAERTDEGYRLRRLSDGVVLPAEFDEDEVRAEKQRRGMWWH